MLVIYKQMNVGGITKMQKVLIRMSSTGFFLFYKIHKMYTNYCILITLIHF